MKNVFCEHCGTIFAAEPDSPCRCSCCGAEYTSEYISTLLSEIGPEQALFFDPPVGEASPYAAEKELSVRNTDPDLIPELQKVPTIAGKTAARKHKSAVLAETSANAEAPKVSETEVSACPRPQTKDNFKTLIITLLSIAGVCLIVAGILLYGKVSKPKKSYKEAQTLLESGKYEAAIKAFTAIGGYEDSATRLLECHYLYGMEALSKGDYDLAVTELRKAGSYHQAKDAIPSVYYEKGLAFLVKEDYDGARSAFQSAGKYADAAERLTECTYLQAGSLRKNASYEAAAKLYLSLGSYSNSADLAKACYYERGMQLLQADSYELAISAFRSAGSYQDAADKILESYYAWGEYYLKAELYDNAEKAFRSAGSYKDAATRISECRYRNALKLKDSGQFDRAIEILAALGGYEESTKQIADCHYQKALKLIEGGYFNQALAELSELDDHDDAAELVKQCNYEIGKNLYETESYEEAMQAFLTAGNYKDAEQWAKKCRAARIRCYGAIITAAEKDAFSVSGNTYSGNGFLYDMDGDGVEELVLVYRSSALADEQNTVCTAYTVDEHGNPVMLWDAKPLVGTTTKASGVSLCRVEGTLYLAIRYEKETTETITIQDDSGLLAGLWGEFSSHEESRTTTTVEWTLYAFENSSLSYYASAGGRQTVDSSGAVVAGDGHTPNGGSGWNSFQNWLSKTEILYGAGPDESHSYNKNRLNMNELLEKCS